MRIETVGDVLEMLEGIPEETPVRLAYQRNYPLQATLGDVVDSEELVRPGFLTEEEQQDVADALDGATRVVWVLEGSQLRDRPYVPKCLWSER